MEKGKVSGNFGGIFGGDARLKRSIKVSGRDLVLGRRDAQVGPDGNIYILRRSSSPTMQVINESGDAVRSLTLAPPMPDSSVTNFYIAQRSLLVAFQTKQKEGTHTMQYALYDLQGGKLLRTYYLPPRTGLLTCFSGEEVTILTHRNGYFAIATADVK